MNDSAIVADGTDRAFNVGVPRAADTRRWVAECCSEEDFTGCEHEEDSCASLIHSPDGSCGPLGSYALCVYVSTVAPWTYRIVRRLRAVLSAGTKLASSRESGRLRPCLFVRYSSCRVNPLSLLKKSMSTSGVSYTCFYNRVTIPYVSEKGVVDSLLGELLSLACVTFDSDPIDAFDSNGFPILSVYSVRPPPFSHTYLLEQRYRDASRDSGHQNIAFDFAECNFTEVLSARDVAIKSQRRSLEEPGTLEEQSLRVSSSSSIVVSQEEKNRCSADDRSSEEYQRLRDRERRGDRSLRCERYLRRDGGVVDVERRGKQDEEDLCVEETRQQVDEPSLSDLATRFRSQTEPLDLRVRDERVCDDKEDRVSGRDHRRFFMGREPTLYRALFDLTDFVRSYFVRGSNEKVVLSTASAVIVSNDRASRNRTNDATGESL